MTTSESTESKREKRDWVPVVAAAVAALPGIAAIAGIFFTYSQLQIDYVKLQESQQDQFATSFSTDISDLNSKQLETRQGAVLRLRGLMPDSPSDQSAIVTVLCTFVRQAPDTEPLSVAADVQSAAVAVGTRDTAWGAPNTVNLDGAQLFKAQLQDVNFAAASLNDANLDGDTLNDADFSGASLSLALLNHADLSGGNLSKADVTGAFLVGTVLTNADLADANLSGANLTGANLSHAVLTNANLSGVNLSGANLTDVNLTGALWPASIPAPTGWVREHNGQLKAG
jgi:uncharacterized protein YjbI with pentapeptide repeats